MADAKQKGVDVSVEQYGTSAHVSHARTDGKRCVMCRSLTQSVLSHILDIGLLYDSTGRIAHQPEDRAAITVHIFTRYPYLNRKASSLHPWRASLLRADCLLGHAR